jgi:hypothetical protein
LYPAGSLFGVGTVAPYLLYRSTGSAWDQIGGAGGSSVTTSDTAPTTPSDGDLWYDSTTGKTFVWYEDGSSDQWVEVGANAQIVIPQHGSSHVRGGSDVIDGDRLTVDYVPTRYTRNSAASGAGDTTDLTAHLSGIDARFAPTFVTSLPSSPYDGQIIYYQVSASDGIIWQLRYNASSSSSYKWEFIGGPPRLSTIGANENRASTTYGDLATVGPSITVPLAGDYIITIGFTGNNGNANNIAYMSYQVGATSAIDADAVSYLSSVNAGSYASSTKPQLKTGIAASSAIVAKYKTSGASVYFMDRFMQITPVRVG